MEITYTNSAIEKLCHDPDKYGRKHDLPTKIIKELKEALTIMKNMSSCADFLKPIHRSYNFERLKNKNGLMSIRLDIKYRMIFYDATHENKEFIEIIAVEIVDVNNHYKDWFLKGE